MSLNKMLNEILNQINGFENLNIVEQETNVEMQEEFIQFWKLNNIQPPENLEAEIIRLFDQTESIDSIRGTLFTLSACDDPKAYRAIEKFHSTAHGEIAEWSGYALNESRMKLETSFSDDNRVYLSTGLGGQGKKLRYFCVLAAGEDIVLSDFHIGIIEIEVRFAFSKNNIDLEEIDAYDDFVSFVCLIPIPTVIEPIFQKIVDDCNILGNFLDKDYVISNIKRLSPEQVRENMLSTDDEFEDNFDDFDYDDPDEFDDFDKN